MEILNLFKTAAVYFITFLKANIINIAVGTLILTAFCLAVYASLKSLKKLKIDVFSYYPFDRFFPKSSQWSSLYFLTVVLFLGIIIFFILKGVIYLSPA